MLGPRGLPAMRGAARPEAEPGLWFTGFTNPISGMLRELRMDAERIARHVSAQTSASVIDRYSVVIHAADRTVGTRRISSSMPAYGIFEDVVEPSPAIQNVPVPPPVGLSV